MNDFSVKDHIWQYVIAVLILLLMQPGIIWGTNLTPFRTFMIFLLLYKLDINTKWHTPLLISFFAVLSIYPITHNNSLLGYIYFTTLAMIPFLNNSFFLSSFHIFKRGLAFITLLSLVVWFLVVVLGVDLPHTVIPPLNELKSYNYNSYGLLLVPQTFLNYDIIKFSCVFDEPGVVGTYCLLMLFSDNFNWRNKENWVFLTAGIVSFSFFFYLGIVLFSLANAITSGMKMKYKVLIAIISLAFLVAIQIIPTLNDMVGYRLEYDSSTGKFVGDNRSSDDLDNYIASIRGTSAYLWGEKDEIVEFYLANAGLSTAIIRYGVVFTALYFLFFLLFTYTKSNKNKTEVFLFLLVFLATVYQRPGLINPPFIYMFAGIAINRAYLHNVINSKLN